MKITSLLVFGLFFIYFSCTPPDSVRLQNYVGQPAEGLYAHVPACLIPGNFNLGETLSETELKASHFNSDDKHLTCEGVQSKTWVILPSDTTLRCTFKNGRLIGLKANTVLQGNSTSKEYYCSMLNATYNCLGDLGVYLDNNKLNQFSHSDEVFTEEFVFHLNSKRYKEFSYSIYYTSEVDNINHI